MSAPPRRGTRGPRAVILSLGGMSLGGCLAYHVAKVPVNVAVGTAEVAGHVAVGTVKVAGAVAGGVIGLAASLAQTGAVTFFDVASNSVTRVPWQKGLTLAGASNAAKVGLAQRSVELVRAGKIVFTAANGAEKNTAVAAGDVVEVGK